LIKRMRFASRAPGTSSTAFAQVWPAAVAALGEAPVAARPLRVAVCTTLPGLVDGDPQHDGIAVEWFTDARHLARFADWQRSGPGAAARVGIDALVDPTASPVVVASEVVLRGADWLADRWRVGGEKLKHMALARRADGLTPAEFAQRWRNHAGRAGGAVIPDAARGLAYVQNHPCPRADGEWAYDAVNEVYFDDEAALRHRIAWMAANLDPGGDDLIRRSWFVAVREVVLVSSAASPSGR
jgi:hypothetical protein